MATEYKRINLLIGNAASLARVSEEGTPAIWSDTGYRLGWLADGAWKLAAVRGVSETFSALTVTGLPANTVPRVNSGKTLVSGSIRDTGTAVTVSTPLLLPTLSNGSIPLVSTAGGQLGDSSLSEDAKSVKSAKPLTLNGATRPAWGAGWNVTMLGGTAAISEKEFNNGSYLFLMRNTYTDGTVFKAITKGTNGVNFPALASVSDNGILSFLCSQTSPAAADAVVTDLVARFSVNRFGAILCRDSEPVMSGITASTAGLSYSNSTTPTSIIAAGAKTIAPGRWGVAGTTWMGIFMGTIQWTNAHTLRFEVLLGATVIADSGAVAMSAISSGSIWSLTLYGTIRTVGASGTLQIDGVFRCTESGGLVGIKGFPVNTPSPAAIDTTVSNTINVRVTAGTASTGNILATRTFHFSGI